MCWQGQRAEPVDRLCTINYSDGPWKSGGKRSSPRPDVTGPTSSGVGERCCRKGPRREGSLAGFGARRHNTARPLGTRALDLILTPAGCHDCNAFLPCAHTQFLLVPVPVHPAGGWQVAASLPYRSLINPPSSHPLTAFPPPLPSTQLSSPSLLAFTHTPRGCQSGREEDVLLLNPLVFPPPS